MKIISWRPGSNAVQAIKAIARGCSIPLSDSKHLIEMVLDGRIVELPKSDSGLAADLERYGFDVRE